MQHQRLISFHSVTGLIAGIFILLLSLSGTLLVFHNEIDAFQQPMAGLTKTPQKNLTVDSCYNIVKQLYPHAMISSCNLPEKEFHCISFNIYDSSYMEGTKALQLFVHPKTGRIENARGGSEDIRHNFMSWLAACHSSFHAGKTGEWLLGFFAIIFFISIATGIILYRRSIIAVLLFKKTVWNKNNLHQIIGTWALLFNLMISGTGFWMQRYVFKKEFYQTYNWVNTIKPSPDLSFNFDSAYQNIKKTYPHFTGYVIYFAQSKKGNTAVYGSNSTNAFIHSKKLADVVSLDSNGAIVKTRLVNENTAADYYDIVNSQLHVGRYGGWGIKILYSLFGLSSGILSITGFLLWRKRKKRSSI
ncbi:MAG: PepSY-associated TM helix domain-containing protein [Ferruginibacter sp.]